MPRIHIFNNFACHAPKLPCPPPQPPQPSPYLTPTCCPAPPPTTTTTTGGALRITGGDPNATTGQLEVFQPRAALWGPVCNTGWDNSDARVACWQLGYVWGTTPASAAVEGGGVAGGVAGPWLMDEVQCTGSETRLADCPYAAVESSGGSCSYAEVACSAGE